ncbi:hypothetical protein QBC35DRAFT_377690 [Podospora australis]|uniref:Uncharacterized protein n=1 Tax=Podospora australis TaxID=1536484 RepID=A0AAN6WYY9_9PEZI|nr:hypothetical protein QBC35DRAFT_377690 [Podospora australis]
MPSIFGKSGAGPGIAARAKPGGKSIRGTISGPIPIPSSMDDDEFPIRKPGSAKASTIPDDEFPIRRPGTGIATPLPLENEPSPFSDDQVTDGKALDKEIGVDNGDVHEPARTDLTHDIVLESPSNPPRAASSRTTTPAGNPASRPTSRSPPNRTSPRRISPNEVSPSRESPPRTSPPARRATNPALSTIRYSTISDAPSKQTTQSRDAPQRKKSTLRSALGRLFGRGKKKHSIANQDPIAESGLDVEPTSSAAQHRSDPTALSRPNHPPAKRSVSLPINELDRPLRSHSIGPDDIMAIESARNSVQLQAEAAGSAGTGPRRRANTTTSRMLFQQRLRNPEWGAGLSPRPASAQGRGGSGLGHHTEPEDPDEIGRAITSDSGNGLRRRSRSLSGLQDFANSRVAGRRRSDEIRFWRQSYDPTGLMSPLSSNAPEDIDDTGVVDISAPDSPAVEMPPKTPPQPFNFGLLSKEMIGMKITHAADIDTRLAGVESRTHKLERVVTQLCHSVPGFKGPFSDDSSSQTERLSKKPVQSSFAFTSGIPPAIPAIYSPIPAAMKEAPRPSSSRPSLETADTQSQISFGDGHTFIGSLHPPSSSATQPQSLTATAPPVTEPVAPAPVTQQLNRPTSTSTVRGVASLPTLRHEADTAGGSDDTTISQLRAELEVERAARKDLEAQVKKLSERLNSLSSTVFAMVRGPSESRSQERLTPSMSSVGGSSPLLPPPKTLIVPPPPPPEQLSIFEESEDEDEEENDEKESKQDARRQATSSPTKTDGTEDLAEGEENFQTPREEFLRPPLSYGAFGEELRPDDDDDDDGHINDDDHKRKKAARTLSLSQLTLGKGQRAQV